MDLVQDFISTVGMILKSKQTALKRSIPTPEVRFDPTNKVGCEFQYISTSDGLSILDPCIVANLRMVDETDFASMTVSSVERFISVYLNGPDKKFDGSQYKVYECNCDNMIIGPGDKAPTMCRHCGYKFVACKNVDDYFSIEACKSEAIPLDLDEEYISLAEIAIILNLEPIKIRAFLRKNKNILPPVFGKGWNFHENDIDQVVDLIRKKI